MQAPFRRLLLQHLSPYKRWLGWGLLASFVAAASGISYGWIIKIAGDAIAALRQSASAPESIMFVVLVILVALAAFLRAAALYSMTMNNNRAVQYAITDLQSRLFGKAIDGDVSTMLASGAGPFVSRFVHDIDAFRLAALRLVTNSTRSLLTVIGAALAMLALDWVLFLVVVAVYPFAFLPVRALGRRIRKSATAVQEQMGDLATVLTETAQGVRFYKAYGVEARQKLIAEEHFVRRSDLFMRRLSFKAAIDPVLEIAGGIVVAVLLGFAGWRVAEGEATIGDVLGFITLIGVVAPELRALGSLMAVLQDGSAAARRMMTLLKGGGIRPLIAYERPPLDAPVTIEWRGVNFSYPGRDSLIEDLSFDIDAGEWVTITGPSGAGKSTILDLCLGFLEPDAGEIRIGGKRVQDIRDTELRHLVSYVEQDTVLVEGTILANLKLVRPQADQSEIERACHLAGLSHLLERLPNGLDTEIGPQGKTLSGGEARRLAIARALLHDGPVLLLDEVLTGLDPDMQSELISTINELSGEKTILQISHDPDVARMADATLSLGPSGVEFFRNRSSLAQSDADNSRGANE